MMKTRRRGQGRERGERRGGGETPVSLTPPASPSLSYAQQQPSPSKRSSRGANATAYAKWMRNRPFSIPEASTLQRGTAEAATYVAWLRSRPPFAAVAMQSLLSAHLMEDLTKLIAQELQKEWADTHCEVLGARLDQQMARVVKEVRDVYEGVRRQLDVLKDIEPKKYGDFRQQFRQIFRAGPDAEWAYQRNVFPTTCPSNHRLFAKVHKDIRTIVRDAITGWIARQDELRANLRKAKWRPEQQHG